MRISGHSRNRPTFETTGRFNGTTTGRARTLFTVSCAGFIHPPSCERGYRDASTAVLHEATNGIVDDVGVGDRTHVSESCKLDDLDPRKRLLEKPGHAERRRRGVLSGHIEHRDVQHG